MGGQEDSDGYVLGRTAAEARRLHPRLAQRRLSRSPWGWATRRLVAQPVLTAALDEADSAVVGRS